MSTTINRPPALTLPPGSGARIWPADMPRFRENLIQRFRTNDALAEMLTGHRQSGRPLWLPSSVENLHTGYGTAREWTIGEYVRNVLAWLNVAELYHVSAPMTEVVRAAAQSLPPYRVNPDSPPAKVGLMIWDEPVMVLDRDWYLGHPDSPKPGTPGFSPPEPGTTIAIRGALWAPCNTGVKDPNNLKVYMDGIHVVLLADTDILLASPRFHRYTSGPRARAEAETRHILRQGMGSIYYHDEAQLPYGNDDRKVRNTAVAAVMSTWLIAQQKIAVHGEVKFTRQARRQAAREGRTEPKSPGDHATPGPEAG
jgi:hypothetical protein